MPELIYKLQPDRTLYLRGFDTFAAAASIHNASPTGFEISGTFRDQADFAVAVLYDADNSFEHPSIRYLPDFNFAGLTLNFSLQYTDSLQPIDSPKYNWVDWASLDVVRADGTTTNTVSLWDNALIADATFPAASAIVNVVAPGPQLNESLSLWYENLAFGYTIPGGPGSSAIFFFQNAPSSASISVGSRSYTYQVTTKGGEQGSIIAAGLAAAAAGDPEVAFSASGSSLNFSSKVNTGGTIVVIGYTLWLLTESAAAFIAGYIAGQINNYNWVGANTTYGLIASANGAAITVTAAQYGNVNVSGTSVSWASGTKFAGITPGSTFLIAGVAYSVASIQSHVLLTLTSAPPLASAVPYLAPRGGRDGNMVQLYTLAASPDTLAFDQPQIQLTGGSSAVTWNCSIDFTALGIDSIRQCWLTFAPSLASGSAFAPAEWQAVFSNWQLVQASGSVSSLQVAGPGSVRIEEDSPACTYTANWSVESGFYSKYFATAASLLNESVTVTYTCQFTHDLYIGTSLYGTSAAAPGLVLVHDTLYNPSMDGFLYSDRGVAGVRLDGDTETLLDCRVNTGSALVARRILRSSVAAGKHTVIIRVQEAGFVYFDFLEAAVLSDVPDPIASRANISPALDFDTDQTYKVSPARLMWMMNKLGYAGPVNEYLGVFWWNQRTAVGAVMSTAQVTFAGTFAPGDSIFLDFNPPGGAQLGKSVFPGDTVATIAAHFASYINGYSTSSWASATSAGVLTINGRSPASPYNLVLSVTVNSTSSGTASITPPLPALPPAGQFPTWVIDDTVTPPVNRAATDWHADFFAQCASSGLEVVTSCSMELVNPPVVGYAALYPDAARTPVTTATGFGTLYSTQCAVGSSALLAYQKAVYRNIAQLQSAAGLSPYVQYGEFLWWYFAGPGGMGYYDDETIAAAQTALGRPLQIFATPNDNPTINSTADALFLRNRLRDHVAALVSDIRSAYPSARCEVLWPYDVNYPVPSGGEGGQLNRFVNLPVEWQQQPSSGLDRMKVEALTFGSSQRNLNLALEAIQLFPTFGWPESALAYLVPVFGSATPWARELALVWAAGIPLANLWALDHICLYNLDVPEPGLERRSIVKTE